MKIQEFKQGKENIFYYNYNKDITFALCKDTGLLFIQYYHVLLRERDEITESDKINQFVNAYDIKEEYNNFCKEVAKRVA